MKMANKYYQKKTKKSFTKQSPSETLLNLLHNLSEEEKEKRRKKVPRQI